MTRPRMSKPRGTVAPVYIGTLRDKPIRFFAPRPQDRQAPWHAMQDLFAIAEFPDRARQQLTETVRHSFPDAIRTVATPGGPVVVIEYGVGRGLLECCAGTPGFGSLPKQFETATAQAYAAMVA